VSLARWGCDDSDVYVFEDSAGGFTCSHIDQPSYSGTAAEMLSHLDWHMRGDQHVPPHCIEELRALAALNERPSVKMVSRSVLGSDGVGGCG
jgi:hypothetical protein